MNAQTGIVPAINQMNFEHSLRLEDIVDLVVDNPFVPPGHEELFARGILAGFDGISPKACRFSYRNSRMRSVMCLPGPGMKSRDETSTGCRISFRWARY